LGPIDGARRVQALNLLIAAAGRGDPGDVAARLDRCASLLGPEFRAHVIEQAARLETEPDGEPEEEPATSTNVEVDLNSHVKPDAQEFARPARIILRGTLQRLSVYPSPETSAPDMISQPLRRLLISRAGPIRISNLVESRGQPSAPLSITPRMPIGWVQAGIDDSEQRHLGEFLACHPVSFLHERYLRPSF
jgi:hypothetical protein